MKTKKTPKKAKKGSSGPRPSQKSEKESLSLSREVPEDWVPIKAPENLEQMIMNWIDYPVPTAGWCLLCNSPIFSEADLIPGTSSHTCQAGRRLEEEIRATEEAQRLDRAPARQSPPRKPRRGSS